MAVDWVVLFAGTERRHRPVSRSWVWCIRPGKQMSDRNNRHPFRVECHVGRRQPTAQAPSQVCRLVLTPRRSALQSRSGSFAGGSALSIGQTAASRGAVWAGIPACPQSTRVRPNPVTSIPAQLQNKQRLSLLADRRDMTEFVDKPTATRRRPPALEARRVARADVVESSRN